MRQDSGYGDMVKEEVLKNVRDKFGAKIKNVSEKSARRVYMDIDPKDISEIAGYIFGGLDARLSTASCVDVLNGMEILYHFTLDGAGLVLSLRVFLDKKDLSIESITPIIKGAEWIEREIHELFGVDFRNHPNLKPLLLPEGWPEGVYPLRKDYKPDEP